ncbi:GntR family transcriptional regulator [Occultella glacieicola]|nr:GntR family transcriptional regulator [Occultella glacieicola]
MEMDTASTGETVHLPRVALDRSSPVPLYHQIAEAMKAMITSGDLPAGTRVENELAMAARLGVSRPTARRAFQDLVEQGLLIRRRGIGTQVASELIRRPVELTSLYDDLAAAGRTPRTEVLSLEAHPADHIIAERLGVEPGAEVVTIERLRFADDEPLALMTNHLRAEIAPTEAELAEVGLYAALRATGVQMRLARQTIGARLATAAEARVLDERPRAALLTMERIAFDDVNAVVEFGSHLYRGSRYTFDTTVVAR